MVGKLQQLVMVWELVLMKLGVHLLPPYTAAHEDWMVTESFPNDGVPGMVKENTPELAQGGSTGQFAGARGE